MIKTIKKWFKKKPKQKTLEETESYIKKEFYYNNFHEELIHEIYSLLIPYGELQVTKINDKEYILQSNHKIYKVTEEGFDISSIKV